MLNAFELGLICWLATTIIVESELFRPLRDVFTMRAAVWAVRVDDGQPGRRRMQFWMEARYLVGCHMCTGVWVGLVLAAMFGSPWGGFFGWIAGGLLYKAIGHLVLELRPQAWFKK